ncbi:MAG: glycosyltransferase family 87 protein [Ilumatobacteraceae bacterium]
MTGATEQDRQGGPANRFASEGAKDALLAAFLFCCIAVATARAKQPSGDWSFFVDAGRQLFSSAWRTVYIDQPDAQTGPITLALAKLLDPLGLAIVRLLLMLCALAFLGIVLMDTRGRRNVRWRLGIGGVVLALWWPQLSFFGHLDDAIVLVMAAATVALVRRDHRMRVAVLAGLAIAVKPTAVFMLAFTVPREHWRSLRSWVPTIVAAAIGGLFWAPFLIGTPGSLDAMKPRMNFLPGSVPALFGLEGEAPSGAYRAAQLALVLGVAVFVAVRRGPAGVLLAATAARMLLDPAAWPYYATGFVAAALLWEAYVHDNRVPWTTVSGGVLLAPESIVSSSTTRSMFRLIATGGALAATTFGDTLRRRVRR